MLDTWWCPAGAVESAWTPHGWPETQAWRSRSPGCSQEKLLQARQELGQVHTVLMDISEERAVGMVFAGHNRVDHVLISAGTIRNGAIVKNDLATLHRIVDEHL